MMIDEDEFFRKATMQICGTLDIGTALDRCLSYLSGTLPADALSLYLFEEGLGGLRTIAEATAERRASNKILPLPADARRRIANMDVPHALIERPGFDPVVMRIVNRPEDDPVINSLGPYFEWPAYSALIMYLTIDGKRLGTFFLRAEGNDRYVERHARLVALLAEPFTIALSNALRYDEVRNLTDLLADDNRYLHRELLRLSGDQIVGGDYGLRGVMEMVRQVAPLSSPVLLRGETGVGKDVIANAIHYSSPRRDGPFIKINCGAIPETLVDSELFGHERGAFTGAIVQKRGCFERANGGTIFLDEIAELPLPAQVRLLRVLQYKEIQRVGGSAPVTIDIRIIAATHRSLETMVREERFREDLWFRLNVFPIFIPPLRERRADIPALLHHFIMRKTRDLKLGMTPSIAPGAVDALLEYHWPGNVRELENIIERMVILTNNEMIKVEDLPEKFHLLPPAEPARSPEIPEEGISLDTAVSEFERKLILEALNKTGWVKNKAAQLLNLNRTTLIEKIKRQNLQRPSSTQ